MDSPGTAPPDRPVQPADRIDTPRLRRAERREALLDAAVALAESGPLASVTMEAVAERAGVSRPLVYRHFSNRGELLAAVYRREAAHLHDHLTAEVVTARSIEEMFRALVHAALRAADERGHLFAALRSAASSTSEVRREQRDRDRRTSRAFAGVAARELGIDRPTATATTSLLLSLVDPVLAQWHGQPTRERAALLEETYMTIVSASLAAIRDRDRDRGPLRSDRG